MNFFRLPLSVLSSLLPGLLLCVPVQAAPAADDLALARAKTQAFGLQLKQTLMAAMQAGGPVVAMNACNLQAPGLAAGQSDDHWQVGRTSARLRNRANAPDEWEQATLAEFAARLADGASLDTLERLQPTATGFRYMQAIGVAGPCLVCHGTAIDPAVAEQLERLYPGDQARGYQPGDLRGAFSLTYTR